MRKLLASFCLLAILLLAVLPLAAQAQTESVIVEGGTMEGVWEITGAPNNIFCRIERDDDELAGYCTPFGPTKGSVEIENGHLHMAFGSMALRLVIDGSVQSSTLFTGGRFAAKIFGVERATSDVLTGRKLIPSDAAPDGGGKAELLRHMLEEMRLGKPTETFLATGPAPFTILAPAALRTLGGTEAIIHIGSLFTGKQGSARAQVYVVEFTNGERICTLNQRDDGTLDHFQCV